MVPISVSMETTQNEAILSPEVMVMVRFGLRLVEGLGLVVNTLSCFLNYSPQISQ